ncbi:MAG: hypothetical protein GWN61_06990 [candidate division Zixibacteria bacterium]|nr:hypothetical protein [candidate division Zixibacteria bacterium]NIR63796.1 hypothetical protein [candidate division Zixibacteria bacterium]NIS14857.1 hypothetical protein [candidate division Zixibacteria bacterium]NIS45752.1 hypothetical protein [candidate division Zixibacteria bacterium]NIU13874.1 hypothetical protein [candidate division Zixibacteria bacterium]
MITFISKISYSIAGKVIICLAMLFVFASCSVVYRSGVPDAEPRQEPAPAPKYKHLGIPPGHLPPPGACRIWIPGKPPGHQPPPGNCSELQLQVPKGAWLVYRDAGNPDRVEVFVYDEKRPSIVVVIRHFEAASGRFLSETQP